MKRNIPYKDTIKSLKNLSQVPPVQNSFKDKIKIILAFLYIFTLLIVSVILFQQQHIKQNCFLLSKENSRKLSELKELFDFFTEKHSKLEKKILE